MKRSRDSSCCEEEYNTTTQSYYTLDTSKLKLIINSEFTVNALKITPNIVADSQRRISIADYFIRAYVNLAILSSSHSSLLSINQSILPLSQYVTSCNYCAMDPDGNVNLHLSILHTIINTNQPSVYTSQEYISFINLLLDQLQSSMNEIHLHWKCIEDQIYLRNQLSSLNSVSFIANQSILPRLSGSSELPSITSFPFVSPTSLQVTIKLPHQGNITGMLIPKGITVITGGGFHGKSTLLRAIATGVYNKICGDGREFCITIQRSVCIRAEDGRSVRNTDISPFITDLPSAANVNPIDFSTTNASGSTSQAASVMEAIELNVSLLLLDEDTCANNFMVRDSRMRSLVSHEPITPYSYRINGIYNQLDISTILVTGGNGDWFDVLDICLLLDNYVCIDMTKKAKSISKTFCTGRVQYNGQGLVHQLPWTAQLAPRSIDASCIKETLSLLVDDKSLEQVINRLDHIKSLNAAGINGLMKGVMLLLEKCLDLSIRGIQVNSLSDLLVHLENAEKAGCYGDGDSCLSAKSSPRLLDIMAVVYRLRSIRFKQRI